MTYTHLGEMYERLPIFGAAILLGLASGVVAVRNLTRRPRRISLANLMGLVVLAALMSGLIAAKPEAWDATATFWLLAAWGMAIIDRLVLLLVGGRPAEGRDSGRSAGRIALGLILATSLWVAAIPLRFDLGPDPVGQLPSLLGVLIAVALPLGLLDLAIRLALGHATKLPHPPTDPEPRR